MKTAEIRQLTLKELKEHIEEESNLYTRMKLNHTVSPLDNPKKLTKVRRNIARLKTEIRKRELNENQNN